MTYRMQLLILCLLASSVAYRLSADEQEAKTKEDGKEATGSLVSGLKFRGIGPALMSGRISDIVVDPERPSTWYVAAASGGVWKTVNAGTTWKPIFDSYPSYSIGCLAIDPNNRFVVWVGTGENNSQRSVGYGDGVYRSLNGGESFERVGLENSEHIGKILIDPRNSDVVYVAAQGPLWAAGGDRGLYKTEDGGKTWKRVLEISEDTGVNEVCFDPRDPDVLYATAYQRRRHVWTLIDGGPESAIYKSTDAGQSWRKINSGLPGVDLGRIGLAVSPINPDVVYAIVEAAEGQSGFYRSVNRGESWQKQSDYVSGSPQYYQEIFADPHVFDRVYSLDTYMHVSEDGGKNFSPLGEASKHVDNHALVIDPSDADHLLIGCDGGVYETWDRGKTYDYKANLPLTQFYKIAVDNEAPFYHVYGGTQDNATQGGPVRTNNVHGIRNSDWYVTVFGDGFDPAVDPEDPNVIYSQWQYGGLVRFDRRTGERIDIKPREATDGPPLRWNWDSALLISPHSHTRLYYGAQMLFQSDDRGNTWRAISPDLTRNLDRNELEVMGRVWSVDAVAKNNSTSFYGTIVTVSESPLEEGLIYAGTDDGLVQVTEDGGRHWRRVESFLGVQIPEQSYVSDIETSLHDADTVYVVLYNFKNGDFHPYVIKSDDRGKTWSSMVGDLPDRGPTHCLAQDHVNPELLFVGTETGVFFTVDEGQKWTRMKSGIPTIAVRDLEIQRRESDLVAGTFGRGFYVLDDYSPLRDLTDAVAKEDGHIFPVKKALMYVQANPLGVSGRAFQGHSFFTAPNPPFGATFTYYLKDALETKEKQRRQQEHKLAKDDKDTPYPAWERLKEEDREVPPSVVLTVRDVDGNIVRRINGSTASGLHRATWDFRYPGYGPLQLSGDGRGPMAVPGRYTVSLDSRLEGQWKELVAPAPFQVEPLGLAALPANQRKQILAFQEQTGALQRAVLGAYQVAQEADSQLKYIRRAIETRPGIDPKLLQQVQRTQTQLQDLLERFSGDPTQPRRSEPGMPGILSRLQSVIGGHWNTTSAPTNTHRRSYEVAAAEFAEIIEPLRKLVERDIPSLGRKLESAQAPWTPGRPIPAWQPPQKPQPVAKKKKRRGTSE